MQVSSFADVQARRCGGVARLKPLADQAMGLGLLLPSDETSGAPPKTGNRPVQSLLWKSLRLSIASCSKLAPPEGGHFSLSAAHCFCCCLQVAPWQEDPAIKACSETCGRRDFLHFVRGFPPKNPKGQSLGPETCHFLRRFPKKPKKPKIAERWPPHLASAEGLGASA